MTDKGLETHELHAGMLAVVPQNTWHRFRAPNGVSIVTATPKPTEHLTVDIDDPRTLTEAERTGSTEEKWR
jgi:mannose-6-phosphate isomerase-like protein (cupin superfamily)